jgi:hypothetical protein
MNYITFLIVAGCRIMKVNPRLETAEILWWNAAVSLPGSVYNYLLPLPTISLSRFWPRQYYSSSYNISPSFKAWHKLKPLLNGPVHIFIRAIMIFVGTVRGDTGCILVLATSLEASSWMDHLKFYINGCYNIPHELFMSFMIGEGLLLLPVVQWAHVSFGELFSLCISYLILWVQMYSHL